MDPISFGTVPQIYSNGPCYDKKKLSILRFCIPMDHRMHITDRTSEPTMSNFSPPNHVEIEKAT
jgi:hypothetical protein